MEKYTISWGLGGGFGGINNYEVVEAENIEDAQSFAFEQACNEYDLYTSSNGLRDLEEIEDEEECSRGEAWEIFGEERESWILYDAIPYQENHDEKYSDYHFYNPFKK